MAGKKVKNEVESIRGDLQQLSEAVWALREHVTIQNAGAAAANSHTRPATPPIQDVATDLAASGEGLGTVVSRGVVRDPSGNGEYRWDFQATVEDILSFDDDSAARILAAIGHRQRLAILKAVLNKPSTAAELVTTLDLGTTGAAYHHLNVLQAANLVSQMSRGVYVVDQKMVAGVFAILAGLESAEASSFSDAVDASEDEDAESSGSKRKKQKSA